MENKISWTDITFNPVTGCTPISEGCLNCYAKRMHGRFSDKPFSEVTLHPDRLEQPLHWKKPRRIFVCSMADLFHDDVPDDFIDKVFAVAALCPQHTFQILTKRSKRMMEYFGDKWVMERITKAAIEIAKSSNMDMGKHFRFGEYPTDMGTFSLPNGLLCGWPLPNVWLGVTVEDQKRADERIPDLLRTPAAVRFVSVEPMLSEVNLRLDSRNDLGRWDSTGKPLPLKKIDLVICGGETGPGARPMFYDHALSLLDQCKAAGVPFHLKQWGEYAPSHYTGTYHLPIAGCSEGCFDYQAHSDSTLLLNNGSCGAVRVGKKKAGYMILGQEWRQMPEVRHG